MLPASSKSHKVAITGGAFRILFIEGRGHGFDSLEYSTVIILPPHLISAASSLSIVKTRRQVFAFLGLADDAERMGVRGDYSLSARDVYVGIVIAMLEHYEGLDVLSVGKPLHLPVTLPAKELREPS